MPTTMEKLPLGYTEGKGNETAGTEAALKLKKPRLYLKLLDEERDLEDYHAIWSNDKATYWTSRGTIHTLPESREWMRGVIARAENPQCLNYGVFEYFPEKPLNRPHLIGMIGFFRAELPAEIGYIFHPDVWGRGYASESLGLFLELFWNIHLTGPPYEVIGSIDHLIAMVDPDNGPSQRVLLKNGFKEVQRLVSEYKNRQGEWRDLIKFRLDRPTVVDGSQKGVGNE